VQDQRRKHANVQVQVVLEEGLHGRQGTLADFFFGRTADV
jgi:hypothetical protein